MSRTSHLLATALLAAVFTQPSLAADPPGSTPSSVPSPDAPSLPPLPNGGPTGLTAHLPVPPPEPIDDFAKGGADAARDQQIDALIGLPPDDGLDLAAEQKDPQASTGSNCYADGIGCGGGEAEFIANCDAQGGGMSSEHDDEHGGYIRCNMPAN
jgi:hypothetical protein